MPDRPPGKRTGPQVTTPEARPNAESPPTATDTNTVPQGPVKSPRRGALTAHLTRCARPPEPGSERCERHPKAEKALHDWQQQLAPVTKLVETFSEPGGLVVDPFLGSGTTAVACQRLGRRFTGCDTDPVAVATARQRIADGG